MVVNGQLEAPSALTPTKETLVSAGQESVCDPEAVWRN